MSIEQATNRCITVEGSAQFIAENLKYAINSILFQRGVYPAETFECTHHYGVQVFISKDAEIQRYLEKMQAQVEEWLSKNLIKKVSLAIINFRTREILETWDFNITPELGDGVDTNKNNVTSIKDMRRIENEIRDLIHQVAWTVKYLPRLESSFISFDVMIHLFESVPLPENWSKTAAAVVPCSEVHQLTPISTGVQKVSIMIKCKKS